MVHDGYSIIWDYEMAGGYWARQSAIIETYGHVMPHIHHRQKPQICFSTAFLSGGDASAADCGSSLEVRVALPRCQERIVPKDQHVNAKASRMETRQQNSARLTRIYSLTQIEFIN